MSPKILKLWITAAVATMLVFPLATSAGDSPPMTDEMAAIEAAARNYIDGWYEGNPDRMAEALHPDLAKRTLRSLPDGRQFVHSLTRDTMIAYTEAGFGKESRKEGQVNEVVILDVSPVTASVKTVSHQFVDYLHLAKVDGTWKIVNVLWEPAAKPENPE